MGKVLEVFDLSYRDIDNLSISFKENTLYSIIGSNNCGKTTLFKLLSGLIPSSDSIYCNDICFNKQNSYDYIKNIGVVERVTNKSFVYKKVVDEMMYPLLNLGYSVSYSEDRVNEILSIFKREDLINKYIRELNICDKELLLIMISLLHKPSVLLLDSVLEIFPRSQSIKIINVLKKMKLTVINFTSSLELINLMDKIILMDNNKILGEYTPSDIYNNDKLFYEHSLEIPIITDLSIKLKMYNLIDKEYVDMKEMVDDIWP